MLVMNQSALSFRTTTTKASATNHTKMCFGRNNNGLDQSTQFTWRLSVKVGDLVRYRQGSLDLTGVILEYDISGDYLVLWNKERHHRKQLCRSRNLEVISESR